MHIKTFIQPTAELLDAEVNAWLTANSTIDVSFVSKSMGPLTVLSDSVSEVQYLISETIYYTGVA